MSSVPSAGGSPVVSAPPSTPVFPILLQHSLRQDLSKYPMLDVGWFDTQVHWIHSSSPDAELMARALSISR